MLPTTTRGRTLRAIPDFRWEVDRLFDDVFNRGSVSFASGGPAADLYETEDNFILEMNLPGYQLDDIDVNIEQGVLQITGNLDDEEREDRGT